MSVGLRMSGVESKMSSLQLNGPEEAVDEKDEEFPPVEADYECEYSADIWKTLLQQEADKPQMKLTSPQLEFRGTLVESIRVACQRLRLSLTTLHAAVQLLDLFMDGHDVREDRLAHLAVACLSLAGKSEEKFNRAPRISELSQASGLPEIDESFCKIEWMVGQYVNWRMLMPTAMTFAGLLTRYLVTPAECKEHHACMATLKQECHDRMEDFLELSLCDVRLKLMSAAEVGCAGAMCARVSLGLEAWPDALATVSDISLNQLLPVARLLYGMMQVVWSRDRPQDMREFVTDPPILASPRLVATSPRLAAPSPRHTAPWPRLAATSTRLIASRRLAGPKRPETCVVRRDKLPVQADYTKELHIRPTTSENADKLYPSRQRIEASLEIIDGKCVKRVACRDLGFHLECKRQRVDSQRLL